MAGVFKLIELVGASDTSFADAARNAVAEAAKTLGKPLWFEVVRESGKIDGDLIEFQVTLKVGYKV
jgi:flavin-binding protein dodecin